MRTKLLNTLALPPLLYSSENWTIKATDPRRITAAEMKNMRKTAGCTWTDYKKNSDVYIYIYTVHTYSTGSRVHQWYKHTLMRLSTH